MNADLRVSGPLAVFKRKEDRVMHPMERAIVEKLKLESGDQIGFSLVNAPIVGGPDGKPTPFFINGVFKDIIWEKDCPGKAVVLVDLPGGPEGKVMHTALDVDAICQIGKLSEVASPVLHTVQ